MICDVLRVVGCGIDSLPVCHGDTAASEMPQCLSLVHNGKGAQDSLGCMRGFLHHCWRMLFCSALVEL